VSEGDVRGTTGTIPGNVTLEDAAAGPVSRLIFDQDVDGTHTGSVSGTGQLLKEGTGRVVRDGVTNVDLTQIASGRLAGGAFALGSNIEVAAGGAIAEFTLADRQVFGGTVFGPGDVWKTGIGTLVLAGNARHTGETVVAGGTLELAADLPNSAVVRVDPGARLAGAGGRIGGDLDNRGRVALGGPGATLPVGGNATLAAGSVLEVSLDDAGNASRLAVAALATLAGPDYSLDLAPGDYSTARTYTVLTAGGIVPGSIPGQAIDDLAFIDVVGPPVFVGSTVTLTVQEDFTNLASLGITPNQVSTAIALEQVTTSGTADARAIRDGLVPLRTTQVPRVLDTMAGETLAAFSQSRIAAAQYFGESISRRLRARNWELSRPPVQAGANVRLAAVGAPRARGGPGAWIEPFGVFGDLDGRGNASDLTARAYGVSAGIDYRLPERLPFRGSEHWRVGLGVGYARHDVGNDTAFMNGDGNGVQTAVYGGYRGSWLHAGAAVRFAWTSMQTDRHILFTSVDRHATASFEGLEWGTLLEVGGHFGDRRRALLHPFVRFQYADTTQDAFAETGAGDLSLAVPELAWESLLLTTGARLSRVFTLEGEFGLEPELRAAWTIDYGDRGRHVPATFWAVPGATPFVTAGTELDRNSVSVGAGYVMMVGDVPLLSTHYDFQFGEHHTRHVISAALLLRW
jgi:outer membrane autotransporter protein